ncbi:MAG: single-stranded-DNA-specific exonuclease RecJ [Flavobacteriaceae bacterium]|nr:single-stranded-DNA-specific exonuclease RecJ [Flavobacteriaceae bacterium]
MRWIVAPQVPNDKVSALCEALEVDPILAQLLVQRGIEGFEDAKRFFRPQLQHLHDPFLMRDMSLAVDRLLLAKERGESVLVYGDYDVDGTTAVSLMATYLDHLGLEVATYIPDRYAEGYGVSFAGIDFAIDNEFSLIVALDCGIKAIEKVAYAKEKAIDFIICDHHTPGEVLPQAVAVLDPKREDCSYPYKELCGCGVGFKLVQAIHQYLQLDFEDLIPYLDLVAIAIGADIVPITGENRVLAYYGLKQVNSHPRLGVEVLLSKEKKGKMTITDLVFGIAPRINAAGRMRHGTYAVQLLMQTQWDIALLIAKEIEEFNTNRRETDAAITEEALAQIEENREQEGFTTVVFDPNWHKGVIGIVASRLIETYYRPTLVFTKSGDKLAASARSVRGFDIYKALEACAAHIEQFGGHKYAAGLTLLPENYTAFKQAFEKVVAATMDKNLRTPEVSIDTVLPFSSLTPKFYRILKQLAPFGPENRTPVFLTENVYDKGWAKKVGSDQTHLKCRLMQGQRELDGIGFGLGDKLESLQNKQRVDVVYTLDENEWNGKVSLQLRIKDIKPH